MSDTTKPIDETTDAATPAPAPTTTDDEIPTSDLDTVAGGRARYD